MTAEGIPEHTVMGGWEPGDPCNACGSTDTYWNHEDGGWCRSCGRSDADE